MASANARECNASLGTQPQNVLRVLRFPALCLMKSVRSLIAGAYCLGLGGVMLPVLHAAAPDVNVKVNWADFLGNLDPAWSSLPTRPIDGPMIANGMLGTYLIQDEETSEIRFEMSRSDLCDVRGGFNRRKTCGYFKLAFTHGKPTGKCRLDLWNAQMKADLAVNSSVLSLRAFADANSDVIVFELTKSDPGADFVWDWVPDNRGWAGTTPKVPQPFVPYPEPGLSTYQNCRVSVQDMPVDKAYSTHHEPAASQHATAWRVVKAEGKTYVYTSTTHSYRSSTAKQKAVDNINQAVARGGAALEANHRNWWHAYYRKSFVTLPHKFEWFHWMQMYKIASMTRADAPVMMDLTGPWFDRNISWNGIWANWNAQKLYISVCTPNQPELSDSLLNTLWKQRANLHDAESDGYGIPWGGMGALNLSRGEWRDAACFAWLLSLSWERYQCTLDSEMLHAKLYPLLKGAYNCMKHHDLFTGTDGKLNFKPAASPEYFLRDENGNKVNEFEDITFRMATMRWVCNTVIKIHNRYGSYAADAAECQATLDNLAPYCIDPEQGFMIGKDTPFAQPHRHDSHELAIFPFYEYTPDDPEQAEVILNTLARHKEIGFQDQAMADSVWGIMRAMFGYGNDALWSITHPDGCLSHWGLSKTTTRFAVAKGFGYVEEVPFLADRVIQEMLLQSWGDDIIRVFPAVPDDADWDNLAFSDFRAKGAFLVSAKREARKTTFIKVESLAGEVCKVKTDMGGNVKVASDFGCTLTDLGNGVVQINNLEKGQWCILYTGDSLPDLTIEPIRADMGKAQYVPMALTKPKDQSAPAAEVGGPTLRDVKYGSHEKHLMDFWKFESDQPAGVLLFIHGGGWMGGNKPDGNRKELWNGEFYGDFHLAAIAYPLVNEGGQQPEMLNAALRAVQFLRYKAKEWNIDPDRIVISGGSAGGCSSLTVALHDDVVDPQSDDPVERLSSRVIGAYVSGAQSTMNPFVIKERIGDMVLRHSMLYEPFGADTIDELMGNWDNYKELVLMCSPVTHLSKDDPPIYMCYGEKREFPASTVRNGIHTPIYGEIMQEACEKVGVECHLQYSGKDEDLPKPALTNKQFLNNLLVKRQVSEEAFQENTDVKNGVQKKGVGL